MVFRRACLWLSKLGGDISIWWVYLLPTPTRFEVWPGLCNIQAWLHIIFYSTVWLAFSLSEINLLAFCVLRIKVRSDLLSYIIKVIWFQNVFMVSSFRPKKPRNLFQDFCPSLYVKRGQIKKKLGHFIILIRGYLT